ncbi:MAG: hypothetical protein IJ623_07490 [Bacteroidales bacterium]|nr:hypothetical protein [Bacteroidales bacterium]
MKIADQVGNDGMSHKIADQVGNDGMSHKIADQVGNDGKRCPIRSGNDGKRWTHLQSSVPEQ